MLRYILKRLGMGLLTMWTVITLTFIIMHNIPGDPFSREGNMPEAVRANLERHYGLDKPLSEQYVDYLKNLARFELGPSIKNQNRTVNDYIEENFPVSLKLGGYTLVVFSTAGILLGILAALRRNKWPDYICMILAIIGVSVPSFIMSTLLIQIFSTGLGWLPTSGWGEPKQMIMPMIALGMMPLAYVARMMRSSMIEVMGQDYIKTAKAKGLSSFQIIRRHALRNAIIPVITILGITAANLIVGSFIVENIFRIPGLGRYFIQSITNRDFPVILGMTIFYSFILVIMNLVVDMLYVIIDPRIRTGVGIGAKKKRKRGKTAEELELEARREWGLE